MKKEPAAERGECAVLMNKPTEEMIREWKNEYAAYKERLRPNRKSGTELAAYLKAAYPAVALQNPQWRKMICNSIRENEPLAEKLPLGGVPVPELFYVPNTGTAQALYAQQDAVFKGQPIWVGVDLTTAHIHVEGSSLLYDELFAYRGLDAQDLCNYFLVSQYVRALKRFGWLEQVLKE